MIFNVPLRAAAARIALSGSVPLWNPYVFSGMPLLGASQGGLLFPLNWFYLAFSTQAATNLMMLSSYALAGLGAYVYARRSGSNVAGALVTSVAWQWGAFLICQISHTNIVHTATVLPWVLWAVDGYGAGGRRRRGVLLAALVAIQAFAGHQQTFAYSLMLTVAYAVVMSRASSETRGHYLRSLVFIAAGVFLAAVQIVPTFELLRNSPRASASYDYFTSFSMPPRFVLTLVAPYLMGGGDGRLFRAQYVGQAFYSEYAAYVGVTTLMLALAAVWLRRDARTKFWAVAAIVCLLLAFGRYAPLGLYKALYFVPVLNLFRVHARHLMEVDFALVVLAGRGLTALLAARAGREVVRRAALVGVGVLLLTCLAVTVGRPQDFALGRQAPVSVLRAPELFLPIVFATLGAWALYSVARGRRGATVLLLAILSLELVVWGQSSGWRGASPNWDAKIWGEPDTAQFLHKRKAQDGGAPNRILTEDQPFDPDVPIPTPSPDRAWVATLQPNFYMMYGIENAAGYDGFGMERYSRLAGDMKVWGALDDAERTLRGESRELDLLNVRYLLTRPLVSAPEADLAPAVAPSADASRTPPNAAASPYKLPSSAPLTFPEATEVYGGERFAAEDLGMQRAGGGTRLLFAVPPVEADRLALLTNLSWSQDLPDGTAVARVTLRAEDGRTFDFDLRVSEHTSEWAYDRPDIRGRIKNKRAKVATSYAVEDAKARYKGHIYVSAFKLPERTIITGGEITVAQLADAPDLSMSVFRVSLSDRGLALPLRREWMRKSAAASGQPEQSDNSSGGRWRLLAKLDRVSVFENTRALPRAWLASGAEVLAESEILYTIRTGSLPDGSLWEPRRMALVEAPLDFTGDYAEDSADTTSARAEVTLHEPNRVEVQTASGAPSILVLSENYFPGWLAYVDGGAAETLRVDYNLRGVVLPAGEHTVEFVYRPKSVLYGLLVSLLTLAALLVWAARLVPESLSRRIRRRA